MKNILMLLMVAVFIKDIFCENDILKKFHQNSYKIKDLRLEVDNYDKNYVNFFEIKVFKYNRTTTAHNGSINAKVDLDDKLDALVIAYKFLSNEYRSAGVRFQVNGKKFFDANAIGLRGLTKCGNLTNFIFLKGITYSVCNFVIDETQFPPLVPNGQYKLVIQFLFANKYIGAIHMFMEVYTPIYYPKY